jgi:hypothetical protein
MLCDYVTWPDSTIPRAINPHYNIVIERYTSKEFYSVIINISAFKKSTIDYRQYLIYKTTINNNIDINTI